MSADDELLAALDWPICECETQACGGQCANEATWSTQFHAINQCNSVDDELDDDGNRHLQLCTPCFEMLRQVIASHVIAIGRFGRPHCIGCGAPIRCVTDVIRERHKL